MHNTELSRDLIKNAGSRLLSHRVDGDIGPQACRILRKGVSAEVAARLLAHKRKRRESRDTA